MTLEQINAMSDAQFVEALGSVFEHSPWVAQGVWEDRPFASVEELHRRMVAEVTGASREQQLALLRAHPDLGTRARMSRASQDEQAGAGLDRLSPADYGRLMQRNGAYQEKFGFPFIFAVKWAAPLAILKALEQRVEAEPEEEFERALAQVYRIALFRLEDSIEPIRKRT